VVQTSDLKNKLILVSFVLPWGEREDGKREEKGWILFSKV
jgi:hypothetical protein